MSEPSLERRYARALLILDGRANGNGIPILEHLALRGMPSAMVALANLTREGRIADRFSQRGLYRAAWRRGDMVAATNLAMACFNRRDLQGYRAWLHRGARGGDRYAASALKRFETRLPHGAAREIGRGRPDRRRDVEPPA